VALTLSQGAQLVNSLSFNNRIRVAMMRAALTVANEIQGTQTVDRWNKRLQLAGRIRSSPDSYLPQFVLLVAADPGLSLTWYNPIKITGSTNANPSVITTAIAHGYTTGDVVEIVGHAGNTDVNGTWAITVLTSTTFSIPQAGNAAGTANTGTVQRMESDVAINFTITNQWNAMAGVAAGEA
jgi:hypothetical protein